MTKKLLLVVICIFALPLFFADSKGTKVSSANVASSVAFAGHTAQGQWCQDGTPGCIPDLIGFSRRPSGHSNNAPASTNTSNSGLAFATLLLVIGLLISRMRL